MRETLKRIKFSSIKSKLTLFVTLCWVTPMILIGCYGIIYVYGNINERLENSVRYTADYASKITSINIENAIVKSRDATYDMNIWNTYTSYQSSHDEYTLYHDVTSYLTAKYYTKTEFRYACVFLLDAPDKIYYVSSNGPTEHDYYLHNVHNQVQKLSETLDNRTDFVILKDKIYVVRNLLNKNTFEPYAVLVLQLDPTVAFKAFTQNMLWGKNVFFTLNGKAGTLGNTVQKQTDSFLNKLPPESTSIVDGSALINYYGKTGPDNDDFILGYNVTINKGEVLKEYRMLFVFILILVAALIPLLGGVLIYFRRNISRPIDSLVKASKAIESGKLGIQAGKVKNDEFGYLVNTFNSMSSEMNRLVNSVLKEQLASKDSRIMALESQINPHFLNNTLEMMNWRARMQGDELLSKMVESLSIILEAGMDRSQQRLIPLSQELKHVDAYLYITSMRFGDRLQIEKKVDDTLLDFPIPRLIIQPLIENAVVHGLEPAGKCKIWLTIYKENSDVIISVKNSGKALSNEDLKKINKTLNPEGNHKSLGIANISERLNLIYGDHATLRIFKGEENITWAEIVIRNTLPQDAANDLV